MAKTRKHYQYQALHLYLSRKKIPKAGAWATFFLDNFQSYPIPFIKTPLNQRGLCFDKTFTEYAEWFENLEILRIVDKGSNMTRYYPGANLLPFLNREQAARDLLVVRGDLDKYITKEDFERQLNDAISNIVSIVDPPVTEEKIQFYRGLSKTSPKN